MGFFDGMIDDVRIYNRALSESEVQALYNETSGTVADSDNDGVIDQWDQCSNTPANSFTNSQGSSAGQLGQTTDDCFTQADLDAKYQEGYNSGYTACPGGATLSATISPELN